MRWLLRAKRWVQNPPSSKQVRFVLIIVGIVALIAIIEAFFGIPEWMNIGRRRF